MTRNPSFGIFDGASHDLAAPHDIATGDCGDAVLGKVSAKQGRRGDLMDAALLMCERRGWDWKLFATKAIEEEEDKKKAKECARRRREERLVSISEFQMQQRRAADERRERVIRMLYG